MYAEVMTDDTRHQFLFKVYDQMFADINQHINVVWQSIGVVVGSLALLSLAEKNIIPIDVSFSLIIVLVGWMAANLIDSSYWYNRNLVIIANIERQFLKEEDLKEIHYYFGAHRPKNKMITHLKVQMYLGLAIATLILLYHFYDRVFPGLCRPIEFFEPLRAMPYIAVTACIILLLKLQKKKSRDYVEFIENSPGKIIDSTSVNYGPGHGFPEPS